MIVLDANVLNAYFFEQDPHHGASLRILEDGGPRGFGISVLTLAQSLVLPTRDGVVQHATRTLREWGVRVLPIEAPDAEALARLRAVTRLRMPGCVVLHAAVTHGSALATFDAGLAAEASRRGVSVLA